MIKAIRDEGTSRRRDNKQKAFDERPGDPLISCHVQLNTDILSDGAASPLKAAGTLLGQVVFSSSEGTSSEVRRVADLTGEWQDTDCQSGGAGT